MSNELPISLQIKYLFEESDQKALRLIAMVEAWLNFRALAANWYADEDLVVEIDFTVMPESKFLAQNVDENWQNLSADDCFAVFSHDKDNKSFNCFVMLANSEIKEMMEKPENLESFLQSKLAIAGSELGKHYQLQALD